MIENKYKIRQIVFIPYVIRGMSEDESTLDSPNPRINYSLECAVPERDEITFDMEEDDIVYSESLKLCDNLHT